MLNKVKKWVAEQLNLLTADTVLAIVPDVGKRADAKAIEAAKDIASADRLEAEAKAKMATAGTRRKEGSRKQNAVNAIRKATGG